MLIGRWFNILFITLCIGVLVLNFTIQVPWWLYVCILVTWVVAHGLGSWFIRWNYFVKSLHSKQNHIKNEIAITFDDGPNEKFTPQILNLLETYNYKATFFLVGKQAEQYSNIVTNILNAGHTIANHTYSHSNFIGFYSTKKVTADLKKANAAIFSLTGLRLNLFRPAFGVTNPKIARALSTLQMQSIGWNKRSYDTTSLSQEKIYTRITKSLKPGDVILLHDTGNKSVAVLEQLLLFLQTHNMKSVTIDQLFEIKAYA